MESKMKVAHEVTPTSDGPDGFSDEKPFDIAIKEQPVTEEREPYVRSQFDPLVDAGTARANVAASKESPDGTEDGDYAEKHRNQTVRRRALGMREAHADEIAGCPATCRVLGHGSRRRHLAAGYLQRLSSIWMGYCSQCACDLYHQCQSLLPDCAWLPS
jgi:hypothetical protein